MRIYPAIQAQMGDWKYYIVRMKMREIAHEVQLAHDIYEDQTLGDAIQRILGDTRVKNEIVGFLARRPDRFFSSIVVASMEGQPSWTPITIDESAVPAVFSNMKSLTESFGILAFGDDPKYYALDGQHRVAAIKLLIDRKVEANPPVGFDDDLLSVIVVLREEHDVPEGEWKRRYRRLFSSLNRYAKPTDRDTNIIMDEDDLFAILTRRLITDHTFFQAPGRDKDSFTVQTKGKNLRKNVSHFTTLQTLYDVNRILLKTAIRQNQGWYKNFPLDYQIRPEEEEIDDFYTELSNYWDAILQSVPDLNQSSKDMRCHDQVDLDKGLQDHLLFWPIGQELFAKLVRAVLDREFPETGYSSDIEKMTNALDPFVKISWELHNPPWRHLLLVASTTGSDDSWKMRSEDRKIAIEIAEHILRWIVNIDSLDESEIEELRSRWENNLLYASTNAKEYDEMWAKVLDTRMRIINGD